MKVFVAASYSSQVDYSSGEVYPKYKKWLEANLVLLEGFGHTVFCALRADRYRINEADPARAFQLDLKHILEADALLAFLTDRPSAGVQTEIGIAIAMKKFVALAHNPECQLAYFNQAIILAGQAQELILPFNTDPFTAPQ